jgi:hypothetical protein
MRECFAASLVVIAGWILTACHGAPKVARVKPEAEQVISEAMKGLYMSASSAPPQSPQQQKIILRMAETASNGKELLMVMRAAVGVFPPGAGPVEQATEKKVRSLVTAKMMQAGTLDQLVDYAAQYPVDPETSQPFVERLFQLGEGNPDARAWYRIRATASRLKLAGLERRAQARGDELAGK